MPVKKRDPDDSEWMFILVSIAMLAVLLAVNLASADSPSPSSERATDDNPSRHDTPPSPREPPPSADKPSPNKPASNESAGHHAAPSKPPPPSPDMPIADTTDVPPADTPASSRRTVDRDRVIVREAPTPTVDPDAEDPEPKLSLPTEADRQAWQRPGFRLGIAASYGELVGLRGAPSGALYAANLRAGLRLDARWSIAASFQYALASRSGGIEGLRFAGTIDPTIHITPSVSVALGFGFGGIVEGQTTRADAMPLPSSLESSYTFPDASTPLAKCSGVGAAALARAEYAYVLGPRMAGVIGVEVVGQWTGCVDDTGRVEPDTGKAIVRRQWWPHTGATLSVGFAWR